MTVSLETALALATAAGDVDKVDRLKRYHYEPGCVRWLQIQEKANPRAHRVPKGWKADIIEMEYHPINFNRLQYPQTWIRETYVGVFE